ncbi:hypothetical protein [Microvirga yunnanensis]|uniref:hypothetical protein n=1 Tax=Microvirga yunnanensis TaxID=2953740 RepID=UPI0021C6D0EE|nr:hypothetical protein [Microvirga sp. HBU65207]
MSIFLDRAQAAIPGRRTGTRVRMLLPVAPDEARPTTRPGRRSIGTGARIGSRRGRPAPPVTGEERPPGAGAGPAWGQISMELPISTTWAAGMQK